MRVICHKHGEAGGAFWSPSGMICPACEAEMQAKDHIHVEEVVLNAGRLATSPKAGRTSCKDCGRHSRSLHRCVSGFVMPKTKRAAQEIATFMGPESICPYAKWKGVEE